MDKEKIRQIYEVLPRLNCGLCGYGNCGSYARAVAEGKASTYLCQGGPYVAQRLNQIMGIKVPAFAQQFHSLALNKGSGIEMQTLRREELALIWQVKELRRRVEELALRMKK